MPSPLLISRKSGLFCRFNVPLDLRGVFGRRFLVRSLHATDRDEGRLIAAKMAIKLASIFTILRNGDSMDVEKLLATLKHDDIRKFNADKVTFSNGTVVEGVSVKNDEDSRRWNEFVATQTSPPVKSEKTNPSHAIPISQRLAQYVSERQTGGIKQETVDEYLDSLGFVIQCCGDLALNDLSVEHADRVTRLLQCLPPNITKKKEYEGVTKVKAAERNELLGGPAIGVRTIEKHLDRIRTFFGWCVERTYLVVPNPFAGRRLMTKDDREEQVREPFSDEDIKKIFSPAAYASRKAPHQFWGPLIALYSGARVREFSQLYLDDFYTADGILAFNIGDRRPDQRVKNKYSRRSIPVHPQLLALGFQDYCDDLKRLGFDRLFPMLPNSKKGGYGDMMSDQFNNTFLRKIVGIESRTKTLHSMRHRFCTQLYQEHEAVKVKELSGHERPGTFNKTYARNLFLAPKMKILKTLAVPKISVPAYTSGEYDRYFHSLKRKQESKATNIAAAKERSERATK